MSILRGGVITVLTVLLLINLFAGNLLWTFSGSLEYNQLKSSLINVSKEVIQESNILNQLEENKDYIELYCLQNQAFYLNESGLEMDIPCSVLLSGTNAIVDYGVNQLIDNLYYKQYNCDFWQCVKEQTPPLVIISEKSYQYWRALFYWSIIISIILFLLIFLIAKNKATPFIISGILAIITAIPFKNINWIFNLIPINVVAKFLSIFFSKAHAVFLTMLMIGIILLVTGLILEFTGIGKKISWNYKKEAPKQKEITKTKSNTNSLQKSNQKLTSKKR